MPSSQLARVPRRGQGCIFLMGSQCSFLLIRSTSPVISFLTENKCKFLLRLYSNYESKRFFFSYNLLNLLLYITFQPVLPSTDHWSHLGPSDFQGALGTASIQGVTICHLTPWKTPSHPVSTPPSLTLSRFVIKSCLFHFHNVSQIIRSCPLLLSCEGEGSSPPHSLLRHLQQLLVCRYASMPATASCHVLPMLMLLSI